MRPAGHDNGTCLGLIAERRITRKQLNERVKGGVRQKQRLRLMAKG